MKKSKLTLGLVASFISALALASCGDSVTRLSEKNGDLVKFVGYNGTGTADKIIIGSDYMYGKYGETSEGTQLYYNAILEALIRYEYPKLAEQPGSTLKSYKTLLTEAEGKVKADKETASENADNNDTEFEDEWDKILESHDCETENDLKEYYLYNLEKTELNDRYYKDNEETLKDQYLGVVPGENPTDPWGLTPASEKVENVDSLFPYHIIHILVKLSASESDYNRGTITQSEAGKLWEVVLDLIDKDNTFESVAFEKSDDTSASNYGDVGIMSTKTSFYNEFKLGIYAYDAILSGVNEVNANNDEIYKSFGLIDNYDADTHVVTSATYENEYDLAGITRANVLDNIQKEMVDDVYTPAGKAGNIPEVPFDVFRQISKLAKEDKVDSVSPENGDIALPRNVLYNQFLNFHSPFVITAEDLKVTKSATDPDTGEEVYAYEDTDISVVPHDFTDENSDLYILRNNFQTLTYGNALLFGGKKVLCDTHGNVIIGVRSSAGIHFMVMRKSVFFNTNELVGKEQTSLQDYYTTLIPGEQGYPADGDTYVEILTTSDVTKYKDRANDIKSQMNGSGSATFDAAYSYRLYEELINNDLVKGKIVYSNDKIEGAIKAYIELLRETEHYSQADSINSAWKEYLNMLKTQNYKRGIEGSRVPTTCAFTFTSGNGDLYKEGGACYVEVKK